MPDSDPSRFRFPACKEVPSLVCQAYALTDFAVARVRQDKSSTNYEKGYYSMLGYVHVVHNYCSLRNTAPLTRTGFGVTGIIRNHPHCPDAAERIFYAMQHPIKANMRAFSSITHAVLDLAIDLTEEDLAEEIDHYRAYSQNHYDLMELGRESIHDIESGLEYLTASPKRLLTCETGMADQAELAERLIQFAETCRRAQLPAECVTEILLERSNRIADQESIEQRNKVAHGIFGLS